jgi:hypothetical protein
MPPGDSVGRNHHHVDVLTFDYDHDVPSNIVANLDARTGLDPPGNKSGKAWRQALLGVRLYALKQCRIVKEFNSGEKLSPPVQGKHGVFSKVRDREAANLGWPDVDYAPLMDEAFHARGRTYGVSACGFHPPTRCQMYPIDQRVGLQDETL